jgi:hypothetical protein
MSVLKRYLMYAFYIWKITSPNLSNSHAIYSSNSDRGSTITSQQTFNIASNFNPDLLSLLLRATK